MITSSHRKVGDVVLPSNAIFPQAVDRREQQGDRENPGQQSPMLEISGSLR
jgi:hypothetical protein